MTLERTSISSKVFYVSHTNFKSAPYLLYSALQPTVITEVVPEHFQTLLYGWEPLRCHLRVIITAGFLVVAKEQVQLEYSAGGQQTRRWQHVGDARWLTRHECSEPTISAGRSGPEQFSWHQSEGRVYPICLLSWTHPVHKGSTQLLHTITILHW